MLLVQGRIDVLTLLLFLMAASRMYDPMQGALQNLAAVIAMRTNVGRMNEILDAPLQTGSEQLTNQGCDIVFDHVGFAYNSGETVLRDVSFTAKQGEVTALVGPSGGGKTTVSRLAARFWDYQKGNITVGGMEVSQIDPEKLMSLYSIVFQDVTLFDNTILENIRLGRKGATDEEVLAAAKLANCEEFAEKLPDKWNTDIGEDGCALSGGERQRISIARAFLKDAPIILLDEATASLDVENETAIQEALSRLIKNKTVLIIAHRMRTVAGATMTDLWDWLKAHNIKNSMGGEMSYNTIQRMLSNRRYIGELRLRDVVQPNAIPALVSGELVGVRPLHLATQDRSVA